MRIIAKPRIRGYCKQYPGASIALMSFIKVAEKAAWRSIIEMRATYPHADAVVVASGKPVIVVNIKGGAFRLVLAAHFNTGLLYILRFMRHAEYDRSAWKDKL